MSTYFILLNWTEQGVKNIKDSPKRVDAARKAVKDIGGELKSFYMLQGSYDAVLILEMPNDGVLAKFLLNICALGNVRTNTLRAYPETEYRKIIEGLG